MTKVDQIRFFAIYNKGTRQFLPAPLIGKSGATWVIPSRVYPPRLFTGITAAKNALNWWLDGKYWRSLVDPGDLSRKSDPSRHRHEWSVVRLEPFRIHSPI